MENKVKCVLFDLDGTLADMREIHFNAFNKSLLRHGENPASMFYHLEHLDGLPSQQKLLKMDIPTDKHIDILVEKQKITLDEIDNADLFDMDKVKLMYWLKDRNIQVGVVTNSIRLTAERVLKKMCLLQYLDIFITSDSVKHKKPSSEGYICAMVTLGVLPEECIIVEDNKFGIQAAKATGATVVEVKDSSEVNIELLKEYIK